MEATSRLEGHVYLQGCQTPVDADGNIVGVDDFRAQAVKVFENLKLAVAAAGASFGDVVKANYYVLDMSNIAVLREVRRGFIWVRSTAVPAITRWLRSDGWRARNCCSRSK